MQSRKPGGQLAPQASDEGAIHRGWANFWETTHAPWFRVATGTLTLGFAAVAAVPENATTGQRIALGVGSSLGGVLVIGLIAFVVLLVRAPVAQRNEARKAVTDAIDEAVEARMEGEREKAAAVGRVEAERDEALQQVAELEAPEDDPDPRVALANRAEHRAARLRALCERWDGRISRGMLLPNAVPDEQAAVARGDALEEYERDHSIDTRAVVGELVDAKVMDADCKRLVERPRSLADLRSAASWMQEAAERIKAEPPDPTEVDSVVLLRNAYKTGTKLRQGNIWGEGAPTTPEEADEARQRAWDRVLKWTNETYLMLLDHFPGPYERAFFGDDSEGDHQLGVLGLHMRLDAARRRGIDSGSWMDARLAVLTEMLGEYDR